MRSAFSLAIVVSFLFIDAIMFHDILKPGEHYTVVEYMTGVVSGATLLLLGTELVDTARTLVHRHHQASAQT